MTDSADLEQKVLQHISQPNYRPVKPRVIGKNMGLSKEQQQDVRKAVKRLVKKGKVAYGSDHLVQPVKQTQAEQDHLVGVFRRKAAGFGFVRPTAASPVPGSRDVGDIYIAPEHTRDAGDGDVVAVRLSKRRRSRGQRCGEIVEIIERETHQFVGTYFEDAGEGFIQIDGTVYSKPIFVGDAGAKGATTGDKVVVEMVRFPSHWHEGEAVILEVLGPRGKAGVDTLTVMREFKLDEEFPESVIEAAREEAEKFDESVGEDRMDLTAETIITIDPLDARDFDDAISLQRLPNGHWQLGVHIADVAHFVQPNSRLDHEAKKRATSVYLPDRVVPMLPETISNNLASLQPKRVRYAKTALIEFTTDGIRIAAEVHRSAIKSRRRFTYEEVDEFLEDREAWRSKLAAKVWELLAGMHELAMILRRRRLAAGAIELTLPEVKIDLDKSGRVSGAHVVQNTESHQIIEEFMLAANEAVAELLRDREIPFLRRIHVPPDPRKMRALTEFVQELGIPCESLESRFEIKRVIAEVQDRPEATAVNYAVLRSMQKAVYSPLEEGHYALASGAYCHFTSPIRRYPDLTVHRIFDALAAGRSPDSDFETLLVLGQHCSDREQRAERAERELTKIKLLNFLSEKIGEQMDAVITGVEEYGLFAQGVELPAEGLIRLQGLPNDFYVFDRRAHSLSGKQAGNQFRLGDLVRVEIVRVSVDRRELDLRLVRQLKRSRPAKPTAGRQKKTGKKKSSTKQQKNPRRRKKA